MLPMIRVVAPRRQYPLSSGMWVALMVVALAIMATQSTCRRRTADDVPPLRRFLPVWVYMYRALVFIWTAPWLACDFVVVLFSGVTILFGIKYGDLEHVEQADPRVRRMIFRRPVAWWPYYSPTWQGRYRITPVLFWMVTEGVLLADASPDTGPVAAPNIIHLGDAFLVPGMTLDPTVPLALFPRIGGDEDLPHASCYQVPRDGELCVKLLRRSDRSAWTKAEADTSPLLSALDKGGGFHLVDSICLSRLPCVRCEHVRLDVLNVQLPPGENAMQLELYAKPRRRALTEASEDGGGAGGTGGADTTHQPHASCTVPPPMVLRFNTRHPPWRDSAAAAGETPSPWAATRIGIHPDIAEHVRIYDQPSDPMPNRWARLDGDIAYDLQKRMLLIFIPALQPNGKDQTPPTLPAVARSRLGLSGPLVRVVAGRRRPHNCRSQRAPTQAAGLGNVRTRHQRSAHWLLLSYENNLFHVVVDSFVSLYMHLHDENEPEQEEGQEGPLLVVRLHNKSKALETRLMDPTSREHVVLAAVAQALAKKGAEVGAGPHNSSGGYKSGGGDDGSSSSIPPSSYSPFCIDSPTATPNCHLFSRRHQETTTEDNLVCFDHVVIGTNMSNTLQPSIASFGTLPLSVFEPDHILHSSVNGDSKFQHAADQEIAVQRRAAVLDLRRRVLRQTQMGFNLWIQAALGIDYHDRRQGRRPVGRLTFIRRSGKRKLANPRSLLGAAGVVRKSHRRRVEVVEHFLERLPFAEQLQVMSSTAVLIGMTGQGLTNIMFCRRRTSVVLFVPPYIWGTRFLFANLAVASGSDTFVYDPWSSLVEHSGSRNQSRKCWRGAPGGPLHPVPQHPEFGYPRLSSAGDEVPMEVSIPVFKDMLRAALASSWAVTGHFSGADSGPGGPPPSSAGVYIMGNSCV